jgi:hypothetical protein
MKWRYVISGIFLPFKRHLLLFVSNGKFSKEVKMQPTIHLQS